MTRAERRRSQKTQEKANTTTYNLTKAQLDAMVTEKIKNELEEARKSGYEDGRRDAVGTALELLLTLPMTVLMTFYWPKSYEKKLPEFTQHVLDYYNLWENDELDMDELRHKLWECAGIRIEKVEDEEDVA